jgi:hypothetical protein
MKVSRQNIVMEKNMDDLERNLDLILVKYKGKLEDNFSVISAQNEMTSSLFYLLGKKYY